MSNTFSQVDRPISLRVGEWVEVKSAAEILATLNDGQAVSGMPFMPEMLEYCGRRFQVYCSAHKTADTIELYTIRRMPNAVHLKELRCDGGAHGGCQAGCLIYWKECWLKRVPQGETAVSAPQTGSGPAQGQDKSEVLNRLISGTRRPMSPGDSECYRCQATEVLRATTEVRRRERWNPRFYVKDLTSRNVGIFDFARFGALAAFNAFLLRWFGCRYPNVRGLAGEKTPTGELGLQPGEWVRVKSLKEIQLTLNAKLRNRGMWFDYEMAMLCGKGPFQVLRRVDHIINEKTGQMLKLPNPCIILDGVVCTGNYLHRRMFSRRLEYPYWREIWLERVVPGQ